MAQHSIAEASQLIKRSRQTIYRDIKQGKLTVTTSVTGEKNIETSELIRVYGEIKLKNETHETVTLLHNETTNKDTIIATQKLQIEHLKQRVCDKQEHIDSLNKAIQLLENKNIEKEEKINKNNRKWWKFWKKTS